MSVVVKKFTPADKNTLRGYLTIEIPHWKLEIRDLKLHLKGGKYWLGLPAKSFKKNDGADGWMPLIKFTDGDVWDRFQQAVISELEKNQILPKDNEPIQKRGAEWREGLFND